MKTEHAETHSGYLRTLPYEPAYPHSEQIRIRVVFDNGNRWLKWLSPTNELKTIPSCIKEVSEAQWKRLKPDADTVLIEVDGKRYVIGKQAQALGGDPTYQKNKCELAEILALVAIEPNLGLDRVHISKFAIALPNTLNNADMAALKRMENYPLTKEFRRNGQNICYTIAEVEALDETYPAFLYAQSQGFFSFPEHKNAVWDIGGGTSIARIYLPTGTMVQDAEILLPGTKELAQQIATEMQAELNLSYSPDLSDIMDAIAKGDYLYGADRLNFSVIHERVCQQWVESARSEIRSKWAKHLPQLGEVLVVGGSAHLAAPICEASGDRFKIAPEPQLFNIVAMAHLAGDTNG